MLMDGPDVFITNNLLEEHFEKGCDIFIYNRVLPDHALPTIEKLKKKYGFKVCLDIDDHWELDPHHILYHEYQDSKFSERQISQLKNADLVTTTHERLAEEIKPFNKNIFILPNAIPKAGQFKLTKIPSPLTRLFWQGSITHKEDIALIKRPIECLNTISGKIQMVLAGYTEGEDEWYKIALDYTAKTLHQYRLLEGCDVTEYYKHYAYADICLVPLLNSPFNKMKSCLKVLEAANLGLPVICSKVHPYMNLPVIYATGTGEWVRNIQRLVASKKRQKEAGQELQEYCDTNFNFNKINEERKQVFEYESKKVTA